MDDYEDGTGCVQVFTTTHNTDLMSNDLLRPDCYFLLENNSIKAISELTEKELRQAHNLQKMYKAGAFNVESGNDQDADKNYSVLATQADFDRF